MNFSMWTKRFNLNMKIENGFFCWFIPFLSPFSECFHYNTSLQSLRCQSVSLLDIICKHLWNIARSFIFLMWIYTVCVDTDTTNTNFSYMKRSLIESKSIFLVIPFIDPFLILYFNLFLKFVFLWTRKWKKECKKYTTTLSMTTNVLNPGSHFCPTFFNSSFAFVFLIFLKQKYRKIWILQTQLSSLKLSLKKNVPTTILKCNYFDWKYFAFCTATTLLIWIVDLSN